MSKINQQPATPLPWRFEPNRDNAANKKQLQDEPIGGSIMSLETHIARIWSDTEGPYENATYLTHAANAYPKLVDMVRGLAAVCYAKGCMASDLEAYALLKELGEAP